MTSQLCRRCGARRYLTALKPRCARRYPTSVRRRARELREEGLTVPQIAERLAVPFGTVAHWIYHP